MDIITAIKTRKSIRGYLPEMVPQKIIREILEAAVRAPSAINTQPWEITVVCGEVLEKIKQDTVARVKSGMPAGGGDAYTGKYKQRRIELAKELFRLMEIEREDRAKRDEWLLRGFRFFDAPVAIYLSADKALLQDGWAANDIGALAQTICLAALNYGLGTCIEEQGAKFQDIIREHTGIPEDKTVLSAIAFGYPDPDFPANRLVSSRASVDEVTRWLGFR